ncbi:MAG: hypothetical protein NTX61_08210 [Bacteroidetes bacterium]|nr:hypothetical protein [Bacteroidota bacterium]
MRVNKVIGVLGKRGSGKTYYILKFIKEYHRAHPSKGILIVDTLDHPGYSHVTPVSIDELQSGHVPAISRIFHRKPDDVLKVIQALSANCLIVFEDATKYIRKNLQEDVRWFIIDSKQRNVDLIFIFHGFSFAPPELFRLFDTYVIFKTDNPKYRRSDMVAYDEIKSAYDQVMKDKNPYARKTVNVY